MKRKLNGLQRQLDDEVENVLTRDFTESFIGFGIE